jgi:hypothetical protein
MKNLLNKNRIFKKSEMVDNYYAIIDGVKVYATPANRGEAPFLDHYKDLMAAKSTIRRAVNQWMTVKPKRLKASQKEVEAFLLRLWFRNITEGISKEDWALEMKALFPYVTTYSSWKGIVSRMYTLLWYAYSQSTAVRDGDTSNYGYRVNYESFETFHNSYKEYEDVGQ